MNRKDLKIMVKEKLKNIWPLLLVCFIIYYILCATLSPIIIGPLLALPITWGITTVIIDVLQSKEIKIEKIFFAYKDLKKALYYICTIILQGIFIFLWSLLFIIPGIIKAISYSAAPYLFIMNPELTPIECINKSKEMMNGHKMEYFMLILSFIPNFLLVVVTFGIYLIYFVPYFQTVNIAYFRKLNGDDIEKLVDEEFDDFQI